MRRFALAFFILALTLPAFAQVDYELTDEYRFDEVSFMVPDGWFVQTGPGEYHVTNFESNEMSMKFGALPVATVQMILAIYDLDDPRFVGTDAPSYLMGYRTGSLRTQMQIMRRMEGGELESTLGTPEESDGWHLQKITSDLNDVLVMVEESDYVRVVLVIAPPGEADIWAEQAHAIGATLAVSP